MAGPAAVQRHLPRPPRQVASQCFAENACAATVPWSGRSRRSTVLPYPPQDRRVGHCTRARHTVPVANSLKNQLERPWSGYGEEHWPKLRTQWSAVRIRLGATNSLGLFREQG